MNEAAPAPQANQGAPDARIDGLLKVTGAALYAADMPVNDPLFGMLATSTIAHGRVRAIHLDEARAVPGVVDIISYGNMDGLKTPKFGSSYTSLGPLHEPKIWHDGQIVALVVANSFEAAQEAAEKIWCDYELQPPSANLDSQGVDVIPAKGNSARVKENPVAGDFDSAFSSSELKIYSEYETPTQTHNPIELFSTTAVWHGDQLTIYEPSQNVYGMRGSLRANSEWIRRT